MIAQYYSKGKVMQKDVDRRVFTLLTCGNGASQANLYSLATTFLAPSLFGLARSIVGIGAPFT
jgi:hypothetical protein